MLEDKFNALLPAEPATARDRAEALRRARREFYFRRKLDAHDVFSRRRERMQVRAVADDSFRKEKARGEFLVVSRSAHRGRDRLAGYADFQGLLDRDLVGQPFMFAIFFSADDAAGADSFHDGSSHERKTWRGERPSYHCHAERSRSISDYSFQ